MHNPPHPGVVLLELYLRPLKWSVAKTAKETKISKSILTRIIKGKAEITYEIAAKLAYTFNTSAESWINKQYIHDLFKL